MELSEQWGAVNTAVNRLHDLLSAYGQAECVGASVTFDAEAKTWNMMYRVREEAGVWTYTMNGPLR